jgi:hypothetical protein
MHFMTGVYTKGSYFYVYWSVTRLRGERVWVREEIWRGRHPSLFWLI